MADSWWDALLERLFTPPQNQIGFKGGITANTAHSVGRQLAPALKGVNDELARQEQAATGAKSAPKPAATQAAPQPTQPQNPNQREAEQVRSAIASELGALPQPKTNPLYGSVPDAKVYLGQEYQAYGAQTAESTKYRKGDKTNTIQEVLAGLNDWSEKKRRKFADLAVDAGLLKEPTVNFDELEPILAQLAVRSAKLYERGIKTTPWALLERYAKSSSIAGQNAGPITTTTVNRSINLTSPRDANALVDAALQQRLGRSPTEKEKKEFLAALNAAEKKEPRVTSTTTTTTGSGTENISSTSNSTTSGGVDLASFAKEWSLSHNKDEAGQYQALSVYMPAFFQALGAPV